MRKAVIVRRVVLAGVGGVLGVFAGGTCLALTCLAPMFAVARLVVDPHDAPPGDWIGWGVGVYTLGVGLVGIGCAVLGWQASTARELERDPAACAGCGYNLTANLTGRCPECGHAIPDEQFNLVVRDRQA